MTSKFKRFRDMEWLWKEEQENFMKISPILLVDCIPYQPAQVTDNDYIEKIGFNAEIFVFKYLRSIYEEKFSATENILKHWVSGNRKKAMPFLGRLPGIAPSLGLESGDDSLGYDFRFTDNESKVFVQARDCKEDMGSAEYYIQVKGVAGEWRNRFFVSETELECRKWCKENNARYIFVFVKNCNLLQSSEPEICGYFDW